MFAKSIVLSDAFLDMPMSARCLYFILNMFADDDGFVGSPKGIMRQCGASEDDIRLLIAKKFILAFETGVIVIKHWRINNYLQNDRHKDTTYLDEKTQLMIKEDKSYTWCENPTEMPCIQNVYNLDTQVSIDKDSIDKSSSICDLQPQTTTAIINAWNSQKCTQDIKDIKFGGRRYDHTRLCADNDTLAFIGVIKSLDEQEYFAAQAKTGKLLKYDWFVDPNNYQKVIEGNYKTSYKSGNKFENFNQRDYDFDELEELLLKKGAE